MLKTWFSVLVLASLWSYPVFASFEFSPIIATMGPSGPNATAAFTVTNLDDSKKTPLQIAIYRREPNIEGKEIYDATTETGDFFQIVPAQIILNPKEKRTVRVTYVGDPKIKQELSFRIISEEFPINVTDATKVVTKAVMSVAIMTKYVGSLYVTPGGSRPDLNIEASEIKAKSGLQMALLMKNVGTEHFIFSHPKVKITVENTKKEYLLPPEAVEAIGVQNILAGSSRKFVIPWPKIVPSGGPVKVTIEVAKQ